MKVHNLMSQLNFTDSDLELNRKGLLSEKQKQRLQIKESGSKIGALILGGVMMMSAVIGIGIGLAAGFSELGAEGGLIFRILMISIFGCFWTAIWGTAGILTLKRAFTKVRTEVKKVEGRVNVIKVIRQSYNSDTNITSDHAAYELQVSGRMFAVHPNLLNGIQQGDVYAVYYASSSLKSNPNELLSAEWLAPVSTAPIPQPVSISDSGIADWVKKGNVLEAIREHRKIHGSNFEDAKAAVNDIQMRLEQK